LVTGTIFNIQRFSIHDGPGIRTTVFLKGCNLHCFWCHNPEAISNLPEIQFFPDKCITCGACVEVCPEDAQLLRGNQRLYLRELCTVCKECTDECFSGALVVSGKEYNTDEVIEEIKRDQEYYRFSGGGVTFSGGEPLLQQPFLKEMLIACQALDYHTAVDTAGNVPWKILEEVVPLTDLFLYDMKAFNEDTHRKGTGVSNQRILENLLQLSKTAKEIWIRIPVIPELNDSINEIDRIAAFLAPMKNISWIELLPFHTLGSEKYPSLGRDYTATGKTTPSIEIMNQLEARFSAFGLPVRIMV
jgi:pyruvate formate lyase activating enzyme